MGTLLGFMVKYLGCLALLAGIKCGMFVVKSGRLRLL